jgi:hypothetical protein
MRSPAPLVIGVFGLVYAFLGLWLWWKVMSGPGDDNPIAMLGLIAALIAAVPTYGILLWLRKEGLRGHLLWLLSSLLACALLLVGSVPFLVWWWRS